MHERGHVDELHGDARGERRRPSGRRREEHEHRAQPLAAGGERIGAHRCHGARMAADRFLQPHLELVEVVLEPRHFPDSGERGGHSPDCSMEGDDASRERAVTDVTKAGCLDHAYEVVLAGKTPHAGREIRVRGTARQRLAEHRHDPLEPHAVEGRQRSRGLRDLEQSNASSGHEHPRQLPKRPTEIGDVADAEADGGGVERVVLERQRQGVALHPGDGVRLPARPLDHTRREVEADHTARARTYAGKREITGATAGVEHAVARPYHRLGRQPPPAPVEADSHHVVHHVVDRRDAVEHRADALGRQRSRLDAGERVAALSQRPNPGGLWRPRGRWRGCGGSRRPSQRTTASATRESCSTG